MSINIFKDIANRYFKFQKYCIDNKLYIVSIGNDHNSKAIKSMRDYFYLDDVNNDTYKYYNIIENLYNENNSSILFNYIIQYSQFLKHMRFCYLYKPEEVDYKCIDVSKDETGLELTFRDFSIIYEFEDTEIMNIGLESSTDPLINFIENGEKGTPNNTVTFVNIHCIRNNPNIGDTSFKFIIGEEPKFNNDEERILFENIKSRTGSSIYNDFFKVMTRLEMIQKSGWTDFELFINKIVKSRDIKPERKKKKLWI